MKTVRMGLALPAVLLLGTAQLGAQEREQAGIPAASGPQACEVSFYTVEASLSMQAGAIRRAEPPTGPPGRETGFQGEPDVPLKGEKVMAVPIQEEPLTIWAELSPGLQDPQDVSIEGGTVQVRQAFALRALDEMATHARAGAPAQERRDRQAEDAGREIEPAGRTEPGATGAETTLLLLQLDTSMASEGRIEVVIRDAVSECIGQIQLVETDAETFPQDDRMDPRDRLEPDTGDDDPDA